MRPSRYNLTLPDEPQQGEMLIFNTLSGSLYALEPAYRQSLEALQKGAELGPGDLERLSEMAAEGFVVSEGISEDDLVIHRLRTYAYSAGNKFVAKVMTTMACNLNCQYCFESQKGRARTMDLGMAQKVVQRIKNWVEETSAQEITLDFYGGEPLLNRKVIDSISDHLMPWCEKTGRRYSFTITTNGTLLTAEIVKSLLARGLVRARVTLDGVKGVQDARRPFRNGKGSSYEAIVANLHEVIDLVPIIVNTVYSHQDPGPFSLLLDELDRLGILPKLASVMPGLEMGYLDKRGRVCNPHLCEQDERMAQNFIGLLEVMSGRGIKMRQDLLSCTNCTLTTRDGGWLFTPDGYIHSCPMLVDRPQYAIGTLEEENFLPAYYQGINKEIWRHCLEKTDCPYLPMCGTGAGCRFSALSKTGDLWGMACGKGYYEKYLPAAMRLELAASKVVS